jgi:putative ABC transport system permease protein
MSPWRLIARSLRFYWRTNLSVCMAVVIAVGVLAGAMVVGDSVQYTLRETVEMRLGRTVFAVTPQNRFFRAALAGEIAKRVDGPVAAVLQVPGILTNDDGSRRINRVQVLGVDDTFYAIGPGGQAGAKALSLPLPADGVILSEEVARQIDAGVGGEIVLRVEKPGMMPRDIPLASDADRTVAVRMKVHAIADDSAFGRFDLRANQAAPLNVFVSRTWLASRIDQTGRANMLLSTEPQEIKRTDEIARVVRDCWTIADAGLELRHLAEPNVLELRSRRVFIEDPLADAALRIDPNAVGVLTYFVNEIRLGDKATPYSMVAAVGHSPAIPSVIGADLQPDQIVINQWLADDLDAKVGDELTLSYYVVGPNRELRQRSSRFKVASVVPLQGPAADPNLMPDFPGLADVNNCRDWKPGIPIDLDRIRPKDEAYWNRYRGTPKAFVSLKEGQALWGNRFGSLTAIRYPWRPGLDRHVASELTFRVDPATVGLFFQPVREQGLEAGKGGTDFGQLFLGLSMFLIGAGIILTALLFVFGIESRTEQIGLLLAVGLPAKRVRRLLLAEGGLIAVVGMIGGIALGLLYTRLMVYGLSTLWSGAVGGTPILFHAKFGTLVLGGLIGLVVTYLAIWITLRKHVSRPATQLLAGNPDVSYRRIPSRVRRHWDIAVAIASFVGAVAIMAAVRNEGSAATAGGFFGAGTLLLIGGIAFNRVMLRMLAVGWDKPLVSLAGLGLRNAARRSGRSLAIVGLLACGVFLVVAVGANRHDPLAQVQSRDSGTGGFAFYGETSVPIVHDLNTQAGRDALGLNEPDLQDVSVVPFRVHEGGDASCLNLNRVQQPRLLGVQPTQLSRRKAFKFTAVLKGRQPNDGWELLMTDLGDGIVPAIGDYPTVYWALGKNIGDDLEYRDEEGRSFRVRIVGMIDSSILQGSLIISEDQFTAHFPSEAGYCVFLIDAHLANKEATREAMVSRLRDFGLVLTPAKERLAAFSQVENTYLSIFTMLGGLGLVLGSVGLGLVVLRNLLERRGELSMLRAVGFSRQRVQLMVFYEHWGLVLSGILWGVIAALVAVVPAMQSPGGQIPYAGLAFTVLGIAASGAVWVWIAAGVALRGPLLDALRNE